MSIIKLGDVQIQSEDLGFPATVVPTETMVGMKIATLFKERNEWRTRAEEAIAKVETLKKHELQLKENECEMVLDDAVRAFKIDAADKTFYRNMWKSNPSAVKDHLDNTRSKEYLRREQGASSSDEAPDDPETVLALKVAEKVSHNKELSQADAVNQVYKEDPKLWQRITEARRLAKSGKGGDR